MWYGKNDNKWDEDTYEAPVIKAKPPTIEDIKHALEMEKLKEDLKDYFNNLEDELF